MAARDQVGSVTAEKHFDTIVSCLMLFAARDRNYLLVPGTCGGCSG